MRIPKNKISSAYSQGGEFVYKITRQPYSGSYYSLNNSFYEGKEYNTSSLELMRIPPKQSIVPFATAGSFLFSILAKGVATQFNGGVPEPPPPSIPTKNPEFLVLAPQDPSQDNINSNLLSLEPTTTTKRYFYRQFIPITTEPHPIKEVTEVEYNKLRNNISYKTAILTETKFPDNPKPVFNDVNEVKLAEQKIPGIKTFLGIP